MVNVDIVESMEMGQTDQTESDDLTRNQKWWKTSSGRSNKNKTDG